MKPVHATVMKLASAFIVRVHVSQWIHALLVRTAPVNAGPEL